MEQFIQGDVAMMANRVMKLVCLVGVAALAAGNGVAGDYYAGPAGVTGVWETASNWGLGVVPTENAIRVSASRSVSITTQCSSNRALALGWNDGWGAVVQNGGTMMYYSSVNNCQFGSYGGAGTYAMNEGTLIFSNGVSVFVGAYYVSGSIGTFNINGGTVLMDGAFLKVGDTASTGYVYQAGGLFRGSTNSLATAAAPSYGYYSLTGGTSIWDVVQIGKASVGLMEVANTGYLVVSNALHVGAGSKGDLIVSNGVVLCNAVKYSTSSSSVTSSVYLCGGTLAVGAGGITNNASGGIPNFCFDGGTLSNMNSGDIAMTIPRAMVSSNGAVIDDGGQGRIISISSVLNDVDGQSGKLVKMGAGTLTLSGACTYSGPTTVSDGTLKIATGGLITNSSLITLASGTATADVRAVTFSLVKGLGGHGTVAGQVIANAGSGLYPGGSNEVGSLTFTNASSPALTNNGTLYIDVTTNNCDQLVVKGDLALGPTAALTISSLPRLRNTELYPIVSYTGTMTGHFALTNGLAAGWHVVADPANRRILLYGRAPGFVLTVL
jgi:autotransporter-associated beta strand protein